MPPRRSVRRRSIPIAATSLAVAIAAISIASSERDAQAQSAEAEALFQKGNKLIAERKIAQACDAYEASNRLEPGAGVLLNLGDCRRENHQLASAWAAYQAALARAKDPKKRQDAQDKSDALAPRISHLTVSVPDASRREHLSLTRDGEPLDQAQWNQALPVDGGDYVIASSEPGQPPWRGVASVPPEHGAVVIDVPKLVAPPQPSATSATPAPRGAARISATEPSAPKLDEVSHPDASPTSPRTSQAATSASPDTGLSVHQPARSPGAFTPTRKIAIGVAGVSLGAVVAGTILGVSAKHKQSEAFDLCTDTQTPCAHADDARALIKSGRSRALEANIAFGVGAAAAVGAGVLWFVGAPGAEHPNRISVVPRVAPDEAGIAVLGRF